MTRRQKLWQAAVAITLVTCATAQAKHMDVDFEPAPFEIKQNLTGYTTRIVWPKGMGDEETARRALASDEDTGFQYITLKNGKEKVEFVSKHRWQNRFTEGGRQDYLLKFYYANSRVASRSGLRHSVCYQGSPAAIVDDFFDEYNPENTIRGLSGEVIVSPSADGFMMGVQFAMTDTNGRSVDVHFRVTSCSATGKNAMARTLHVAKNDSGADRAIASGEAGPRFIGGVERVPAASSPEAGFTINDKPRVTAAMRLPAFALRADYDQASATADDRPWRNTDISNVPGAEKFAVQMQQYFYDGMVNQNAAADRNVIAQNNGKRYWCHMPWLNVGNAGREGIHGLTNERALEPSPIYPDATEGSDWGVGFYNAVACRTIGEVFGPESGPKDEPDWTKASFRDGSVAVKILFTTAQFPSLMGAFTWKANVSLAHSTSRLIRDVRHIQMDIAVRDSAIQGTRAANNNWVMLTYYYDAKYNSPMKLTGLPTGFKKMRPVGVQTGFGKPETGDSIIFAGAKTNQAEGRLNGPADNPKSSCLSCHGTAGTRMKMSPGVMENSAWERAKGQGHLDFSQQFALAKKNQETQAKPRR